MRFNAFAGLVASLIVMLLFGAATTANAATAPPWDSPSGLMSLSGFLNNDNSNLDVSSAAVMPTDMLPAASDHDDSLAFISAALNAVAGMPAYDGVLATYATHSANVSTPYHRRE